LNFVNFAIRTLILAMETTTSARTPAFGQTEINWDKLAFLSFSFNFLEAGLSAASNAHNYECFSLNVLVEC